MTSLNTGDTEHVQVRESTKGSKEIPQVFRMSVNPQTAHLLHDELGGGADGSALSVQGAMKTSWQCRQGENAIGQLALR